MPAAANAVQTIVQTIIMDVTKAHAVMTTAWDMMIVSHAMITAAAITATTMIAAATITVHAITIANAIAVHKTAVF